MSTKDSAELRGILVQLDRGELLGKGGVDWALKEIEAITAAQVAAALTKLNKSSKLIQSPHKRNSVRDICYQQGAQAAHKMWHEQIDETLAHLTTGQKEGTDA